MSDSLAIAECCGLAPVHVQRRGDDDFSEPGDSMRVSEWMALETLPTTSFSFLNFLNGFFDGNKAEGNAKLGDDNDEDIKSSKPGKRRGMPDWKGRRRSTSVSSALAYGNRGLQIRLQAEAKAEEDQRRRAKSVHDANVDIRSLSGSQILRRLERSNEMRAQTADPDLLNVNGKLICIASPENVREVPLGPALKEVHHKGCGCKACKSSFQEAYKEAIQKAEDTSAEMDRLMAKKKKLTKVPQPSDTDAAKAKEAGKEAEKSQRARKSSSKKK